MYIPIRRESEIQDKSLVFTRIKRECTLNCVNFEQKNDYESENIAKLIREAKKANVRTLG